MQTWDTFRHYTTIDQWEACWFRLHLNKRNCAALVEGKSHHSREFISSLQRGGYIDYKGLIQREAADSKKFEPGLGCKQGPNNPSRPLFRQQTPGC